MRNLPSASAGTHLTQNMKFLISYSQFRICQKVILWTRSWNVTTLWKKR